MPRTDESLTQSGPHCKREPDWGLGVNFISLFLFFNFIIRSIPKNDAACSKGTGFK